MAAKKGYSPTGLQKKKKPIALNAPRIQRTPEYDAMMSLFEREPTQPEIRQRETETPTEQVDQGVQSAQEAHGRYVLNPDLSPEAAKLVTEYGATPSQAIEAVAYAEGLRDATSKEREYGQRARGTSGGPDYYSMAQEIQSGSRQAGDLSPVATRNEGQAEERTAREEAQQAEQEQAMVETHAKDKIDTQRRSMNDNELWSRYLSGDRDFSEEEQKSVDAMFLREKIANIENTLATAVGGAVQGGMRKVLGSDEEGTYGGNPLLQGADFAAGTLANLPGGILSLLPKAVRVPTDIAAGTTYQDGGWKGNTIQDSAMEAIDLGLDAASMIPIAGSGVRGARAVAGSASRTAANQAATQGGRGLLRTAGKEAVVTGLPEGVFETAQSVSEDLYRYGETSPESAIQGFWGGVLGGSAFGGGSAVAQTLGDRAAIKRAESSSGGVDIAVDTEAVDATPLAESKEAEQAAASTAPQPIQATGIDAVPDLSVDASAVTAPASINPAMMETQAPSPTSAYPMDSLGQAPAPTGAVAQPAPAPMSQTMGQPPAAPAADPVRMAQAQAQIREIESSNAAIAETMAQNEAKVSPAAVPTAETVQNPMSIAAEPSQAVSSASTAGTAPSVVENAAAESTASKQRASTAASVAQSVANNESRPAELTRAIRDYSESAGISDVNPAAVKNSLLNDYNEGVINEITPEIIRAYTASQSKAAPSAASTAAPEPEYAPPSGEPFSTEAPRGASPEPESTTTGQAPADEAAGAAGESTRESAGESKKTSGSKTSSESNRESDSEFSATAQRLMDLDAEMAEALKGSPFGRKKRVASQEVMKKEAKERYGNASAKDLASEWVSSERAVIGDQGIFDAWAALERARELKETNTVAVILEQIQNGAIISGTGGSGRALRILQEFGWEAATPEVKQKIVASFVARERKKAGMEKLTEAEMNELRFEVQKSIDAQEVASDAFRDIIKALEGLDEGKEMTVKETKKLLAIAGEAEAEADIITGRTNNTISKFLPKNSIDGKAATFVRASLLTNPYGRIRDVIQTEGAVAVLTAESVVTAVINAGIQKAAGKPMGLPTHVFTNVMSGTKVGLKRAGAAVKGNLGDSSLIGSERRKSNLSPKNWLTRFISGLTEIPTHLVEGLKTGNAYGLAEAKNKQLGYTGEELEIRAYLDSVVDRKIVGESTQYGLRASFLQDNAITDAFDSFAKWIERLPYVGKSLRCMVIPFTHVSGGRIHEALTKRNFVANLVGMVNSAAKRDVAGFTNNLGRLIVNSGFSTAGYFLAKAGFISLTDANGDDYEGLYLNFGGVYIPLNQLPDMIGFSVMIGAAGEEPEILSALYDMIKAVSGMSDLSLSSSPLMQVIEGGPGAMNGWKVAGSIISSFVPALFTAVNATRDWVVEQLHGEDRAIDTRVTMLNDEGKEVTDHMRTEANKILAKFPELREQLPRTDEKTIKNPVDVITMGNHERGAGFGSLEVEESEEVESGKETIEEHEWYDIKTNEDTGVQTIVRHDGETPMYSKDISGADLTSTELKYLSMTRSEFERDQESDRWGNLVDFYRAQTKAIDNELSLTRNAYNSGTASLQDLADVEKKLVKSQDDGKIAGVNKNVLDNGQAIVSAAGVDSVFELMNLYEDVGVEAWRKLDDNDPVKIALKQYDDMRTAEQVSDRYDGDKTQEKYYDKETKPSGRSGRGGGGSGSTRYHVPSVADLRMEQYFPKGNKESVSTTENKKSVAPITFERKEPTVSAGKGITTKVPTAPNANTIKYTKSKTRQPEMGTSYMNFIEGKSSQSSFKAQREYRS